MMGFGNGMMGGLGSGYGGGYLGAGFLGIGIQLLSLILLITIGIALFRWLVKRIPASSNNYTIGNALSIINERYARGEISSIEYTNLRNDISN